MISSYLALKRELPRGMVLMMKIGRFYETFGEDAVVSSPILGVVLTSRGNMPACAFDEAHIDSFLAKFVRAGKAVALAERVDDSDSGRWEIVRVIK